MKRKLKLQKKLFAAVLGVSLVGATAAWAAVDGVFGFVHDIVVFGYEDAEACENDWGKWDPAQGCVFEVEDLVEVVPVKRSGYQVRVSTVGTNADVCDFMGRGRLTEAGHVVAETQTEEWDEEQGKLVPVTCEVTVSYVDGDTVNVSDNGKCRSFCGMRATLDIAGAKRRTN